MEYYRSFVFTEPHGFTRGVEGPACDSEGNLYAVNFARQGTIGKVSPNDGSASVFIELPEGSIANGIRFNSKGDMFIADYTMHNIWRYDMKAGKLEAFVHEDRMNQPNDICITANDIIFASDPNWKDGTGNLWRAMPDGTLSLIESGMGTTNGIEISPDEKYLYVNESRQIRIWRYDLSEDGTLSNKTLFYQFEDGSLDGMRCDIKGNIYQTRFDKGKVVVISPEGRQLTAIYLHGQKPTNVAFGGEDGKTVYVTIMDEGNVEKFRTQIEGRAFRLNKRWP